MLEDSFFSILLLNCVVIFGLLCLKVVGNLPSCVKEINILFNYGYKDTAEPDYTDFFILSPAILTHKHLKFPPGNIGFCHHFSKKWPGARSAPCHFFLTNADLS